MDKEKKREYDREYRKKNADKRAQNTIEWQRNNPEKFRAKQRRWYLKAYADPVKRQAILDYNHQQRQKTKYKAWYATNRTRILEMQAVYHAARADDYRRWGREFKDRHRDRLNAETRARRKTPEGRAKVCEYRRRRYAMLVRASIGTDIAATIAFYKETKTLPVVICHWCKREVPVNDRVVDHLVPLIKGGAHAVSNLVRSCFKCNARKHDLMPDEFLLQI